MIFDEGTNNDEDAEDDDEDNDDDDDDDDDDWACLFNLNKPHYLSYYFMMMKNSCLLSTLPLNAKIQDHLYSY